MDEKIKSYEQTNKEVINDDLDVTPTEQEENIDNLLEELNSDKITEQSEVQEDINAEFFRDIVDAEDKTKYTENDLRFEQFNELREARRKGRILEGRISSVRYSDDKLKVFAYITREKLEICIPATELIENSSLNSSFFSADTKEQAERYYQIIRKRMGSKVSFLLNDCRIEKYDTETGAYIFNITGSVIQANKLKRDYYFFGNAQKVKVGSLVQAKVLSYNDKVAVVSCCGCEIPMTVQDIQWREYIDNLRHFEDFGVGKTFEASVYKLSVDKAAKTVNEFRVSRRYLGHDELKKSIDTVKIGRSYLGQVIAVEPGTKRAIAYIKDKTVRCFIPARSMVVRQLYPGDNIIVTVTKIDKEHCFAVGSAVEITIA